MRHPLAGRKGWQRIHRFGMVGDFVTQKEEDMLTLTDTASTVVKGIVERSGAPAGSGLRIDTEGDSRTEFAVEIAAVVCCDVLMAASVAYGVHAPARYPAVM